MGKRITDFGEVIYECKEVYLLVGNCCFEPADLIWLDTSIIIGKTLGCGPEYWPMRGQVSHQNTNKDQGSDMSFIRPHSDTAFQ